MKKRILQSMVVCSLIALCVSCSSNSSLDVSLIPVLSGEKWGYIDKKGEYAINPQFEDAGFFRGGLARVIAPDGKYGYINKDGKYEIAAQYKRATHFSQGLAFVVSDASYPTCINTSGETVFSLKQALGVYSFSEGLALFATADKKFGFVDTEGRVVINPQFEEALPFSEGLAAIEQKGKWGFIDKTGKIVINPQFNRVSWFVNGKAAVYNGKQWGFIDNKGSYVINPQFDRAGDFNEGFAVILQGKLYGYITKEGKIEINPQFDSAEDFSNSLACIRQGDRYGYINTEGKIEINPQFDQASSFFGNIAFVESADKWGVIDSKGKYVVNPQFDRIKIEVEQFSFVETDYYDASAFIEAFFKRAEDDSFDGFSIKSTLQSVADNPRYEDVNASSERTAYSYDDQEITSDISISSTYFRFANPIYEYQTTYENFWGYRYETGSKKVYKFSSPLAVVEYHFNLSGDARNRGGAVAHALKAKIESRYKVTMAAEDGKFTALRSDAMSFAITYSDYSLSFFVGFNKEALQDVLTEQNDY
ncbi:MAG: WG repeat-containing protein [Bacteroidales bacterium]|jgi:hypothetical protein|nr:WG repeat-containing protein [Bacteroidales bacterium]